MMREGEGGGEERVREEIVRGGEKGTRLGREM